MTANTKFAVPGSTMSFSRVLCGHRDVQYRILTEGRRPDFKSHDSSCKDPCVNMNMSTVSVVFGKEPAGYGSQLENP